MTVDTGNLRRWADAVKGWNESGMTLTTMTVAADLATLSREAADEIEQLRSALAAVPHSTLCAFMTTAYEEPCSCPKSLGTRPESDENAWIDHELAEPQQYRVVADRDWEMIQPGDRVTYVEHPNEHLELVRIERPVPTTQQQVQYDDGEWSREVEVSPVPTTDIAWRLRNEPPEADTADEAADVIERLRSDEHPSVPTREQIDTAVGEVLFNASNYPRPAIPHILGQDIAPLRTKVTDAVVALLSQPTPTAEPTSEKPHAPSCDGWMQDEGGCTCRPAEPPHVEDMAPGTTFTAEFHGEQDRFFRCKDSLARAGRYLVAMDAIDPSTICDVTPPPTGPTP